MGDAGRVRVSSCALMLYFAHYFSYEKMGTVKMYIFKDITRVIVRITFM